LQKISIFLEKEKVKKNYYYGTLDDIMPEIKTEAKKKDKL